MSCELSIIPDTQIVLFRWEGPITLDDRMANKDRVMKFCKDNGIRKIIADTRAQINETSTTDIFDFASDMPSTLFGILIAVVIAPLDKDMQFAETVASNRGANSRIFLSIEEARSWLDSEET